MSSSITDLVNASPPTDAARPLHFLLHEVTAGSDSGLIVRNMWQTPAVRDFTAQFSRAFFTELTVLFVPDVASASSNVAITSAFLPDQALPNSVSLLYTYPDCSHFISGRADAAPAIHSRSVEFNVLALSPLIKPAPVEKSRLSFAFQVRQADSSGGSVNDSDEVILRVFVRARIQLGGQS